MRTVVNISDQTWAVVDPEEDAELARSLGQIYYGHDAVEGN